MRTTKAILFGGIIGFFWAFVPIYLSELNRDVGESVSVIVSGVLTGMIVSGLLSIILVRNQPVLTLMAGMASLPLGAFVFGVVASFIHLIIQDVTGTSYRFVENEFAPVRLGLQYAVFGSITIFGLMLFPLAIFTTFILEMFINTKGASRFPDRKKHSFVG